MNRLSAFVAAVATIVCAATAAHAQQMQAPPRAGWYLQGNVGATWLQDDHYSQAGASGDLRYDNPAWGGSGALGYKFGNGFRVDLELGYSEFKYKSITVNGANVGLSGTTKVFAATVGGYYDFALWRGFNPYVGGGLGLAHADTGTVTATFNGATASSAGGSETDFMAFGETGFNIALGTNLELVPSYRLIWISDGRNGFDNDIGHQVRLGLRYTF